MFNCHICLIEDDEIMGGALALRFELEGHACDWHKTGAAALAALRGQNYGAVVSDIALPDMSGEALYLDLLESGGSVPPFIFMTGYGAVDQAVRLLKRGAVDYLLKPFEPDLLLDKLRELASCHEAGQTGADVLGGFPGHARGGRTAASAGAQPGIGTHHRGIRRRQGTGGAEAAQAARGRAAVRGGQLRRLQRKPAGSGIVRP